MEEELFIPFPSLSSLVASLPAVSADSQKNAEEGGTNRLRAVLATTSRYYLSVVAEWLRICVEKTFCDDR